jgi:uncharacterized Zn finger protein (UPF0148 family)
MTAATTSTHCPRCSSSLIEIRIDQAGRAMVMRSCSTCDSRWWQRDGEDVALCAVLETVASAKKPKARTLAAAGSR